jgi:hypothetical protein
LNHCFCCWNCGFCLQSRPVFGFGMVWSSKHIYLRHTGLNPCPGTAWWKAAPCTPWLVSNVPTTGEAPKIAKRHRPRGHDRSWLYMEVSWNGGTPKSFHVCRIFQYHPFWDTHIYGSPHMYIYIIWI